jgi:hypothetical protein
LGLEWASSDRPISDSTENSKERNSLHQGMSGLGEMTVIPNGISPNKIYSKAIDI